LVADLAQQDRLRRLLDVDGELGGPAIRRSGPYDADSHVIGTVTLRTTLLAYARRHVAALIARTLGTVDETGVVQRVVDVVGRSGVHLIKVGGVLLAIQARGNHLLVRQASA